VTELAIVWPFDRPEDVVPAVLASTARIGPILAMQTPEQRRNIENAITEGAKSYATARGVEIPAPAIRFSPWARNHEQDAEQQAAAGTPSAAACSA
jgi:hypothetical protein